MRDKPDDDTLDRVVEVFQTVHAGKGGTLPISSPAFTLADALRTGQAVVSWFLG